ncbi:NB-ARC domain-containing protein [Amycolatopsis aidingensis]|uniref:NB-ARC domain-containing protein n=1 Tax=Amycolatopsis aidingensis TaxID=2842453 RepID=UPI001C0DDC8B|nr:NB-ARC domain-containing protein [Amycolatopsis aidingensis]
MHNEFGGDADNVIQGRDIYGGVHFHQARGRLGGRCQVPPAPPHYTDNERPLAELDAWLSAAGEGPRVAILRGPPGCGTTTLAGYWVHQHEADYPEGHFFVRLGTGPDEAEQERPALAELLLAAGHHPDEIPASLEGRAALWRSWSSGKRIALVIDDALTAGQVRALLPGAGTSAVLVTEAGRVASLRAWASATTVDIAPMADDAARLLLDRLVGADRLAAEPDAVAELIELCAGSTVALCVVGSLLTEFPDRPVARLARRLARQERTLHELSRDEDLSVTVVFDAAYHRQSPLAQRCYQALGVHPGSGDVSADAVAVALGADAEDVEDALQDLLRARLIQETGPERYLSSGLIRRHAVAKAGEHGTGLRRHLLAYYWARALAADALLLPHRGWRQRIWPELTVPEDGSARQARDWLEAERINLREAVTLAYELGEFTRACQLCLALWPLHDQGKYAHDMAATNRIGELAAVELGDWLAAAVLTMQHGFAHRELGDPERAGQLFETALGYAERAGSLEAQASVVESHGLVRLDQDLLPEAADLLRRNLALAEELAVPRRLALARLHLAKVEPPEVALPLLELSRAELAAEPYNLVKVDLWRGKQLLRAGRLAEAAELLAEAAATANTGNWHAERAQLCEALAELALARDEPEVARSYLRDALAIYRLREFTHRGLAVQARLDELG